MPAGFQVVTSSSNLIKDVHRNEHSSVSQRALIIEDIQIACTILQTYNYKTDRLTHNELMAGSGQYYHDKLRKGEYTLLWIATPSDWYVRVPGKRGNPHWQRVITLVKQGHMQGMTVIMFGPPGFLWKIPNIKETLDTFNMDVVRMRLCHFNLKYDQTSNAPSGSYVQVATNKSLPPMVFKCNCRVGIDKHVLDWYGKTEEHAEWRRSVLEHFCSRLCTLLFGKIQDSATLPSSTRHAKAYPTDARIRQKERLKRDKEDGIKPKKRPKIVEEGNDDCGDDPDLERTQCCSAETS